MKVQKEPEKRIFPVIFSLPFIIFVFLLVTASCFLLLKESAGGLFDKTFFQNPRGFFLLVIIPVSFIALASFLFYGISSEIMKTGKMHKSGINIFQLFCGFAILVAIIFCVFSSFFMNNIFSVYNDNKIHASIINAEKTAEEYTNLRKIQLETVARKFLTGVNIGNQRAYPRQWIPEIREFDSNAQAVQVYLVNGENKNTIGYQTVKEEGDSSVFIKAEKLAEMKNGIITDSGNNSCIRILKTVKYAGNTYLCLYTSAFPVVIKKAEHMIEEMETHIFTLKRLAPLIPYSGIWLFSSFILPPFLFLLLMALYICVRLSDPLASLNRVCGEISRGDNSTSLVSHRIYGLEEAVSFINNGAEIIHAKNTLSGRNPEDQESAGEKPGGDVKPNTNSPIPTGDTGTEPVIKEPENPEAMG